jgi:predicted nucleic acid-binding protein
VDRPALVVDAGPLYAYVDRRDRSHADTIEVFERYAGRLFVPVMVIAEVMHLVGTRLGVEPEIRLLADFAAGTLIAEEVAASDWLRIGQLVERYRDLPLGTVDASVVAAAERLDVRKVATLDRRHFSVVRPAHVEAFELLP